MPHYLRQSTASQEIPLGQFVDSVDGNTEEGGLTIANTDIKLWKTGATTLASKNSGGATYISNGVYYAVLDATDTDTLGTMYVFVHVAGALCDKKECVVLSQAIYDQMFGAAAFATAAAVAVAICDEALAGHSTAGTLGKAITDINTKTAFLPSATAGQAGGVFIAGTNAATSVTTALTANITGNLSGTVGALGATAKADVNAEVLDVMNVDTYAEPGQAAPAATTSLAAKINMLYKAWRNRKSQTSTTFSLFADDGTTVDQKCTVSDDGTTAVKGEIVTGP